MMNVQSHGLGLKRRWRGFMRKLAHQLNTSESEKYVRWISKYLPPSSLGSLMINCPQTSLIGVHWIYWVIGKQIGILQSALMTGGGVTSSERRRIRPEVYTSGSEKKKSLNTSRFMLQCRVHLLFCSNTIGKTSLSDTWKGNCHRLCCSAVGETGVTGRVGTQPSRTSQGPDRRHMINPPPLQSHSSKLESFRWYHQIIIWAKTVFFSTFWYCRSNQDA